MARPGVAVFAVAPPVGGDVAGVAHGYAVDIGRIAQNVDDLECPRLLTLDPVGVDGVHHRDRGLVAQATHDGQSFVEVATDLQHLGAVDESLGQLAQGDVTFGDEHGTGEPGPGGVGGGRGRGVARRGADDGLGPLLQRLGDGQGHAPVLEGARRD